MKDRKVEDDRLIREWLYRPTQLDEDYDVTGIQNVALERWLIEMEQSWRDMYDESDPSMAELGPAAWNDQVAQATSSLRERVVDAVEEIDSDLVNGDFYMG